MKSSINYDMKISHLTKIQLLYDYIGYNLVIVNNQVKITNKNNIKEFLPYLISGTRFPIRIRDNNSCWGIKQTRYLNKDDLIELIN